MRKRCGGGAEAAEAAEAVEAVEAVEAGCAGGAEVVRRWCGGADQHIGELGN
mgnify:CR=1 FL=1